MLKVANKILTLLLVAVVVLLTGCENDIERIESSAYINNETVKGESKNCAVVLRAEQGTSYTITIQSVGDWAHFSGGVNQIEGVMEATDKVIYIYFSKNDSGQNREANVYVDFSYGGTFSLFFKQESYDSTVAINREWAELPVCKNDNGYIFNTHYGKLGLKDNARNYTYCFDPDVRASLWVAYPLHSSHMSGEGNRNYSSFGYDPDVENALQANMTKSYNGWYDRGHQLPAADRKCSQQMMDQTFYATNMTPSSIASTRISGAYWRDVCAIWFAAIRYTWLRVPTLMVRTTRRLIRRQPTARVTSVPRQHTTIRCCFAQRRVIRACVSTR